MLPSHFLTIIDFPHSNNLMYSFSQGSAQAFAAFTTDHALTQTHPPYLPPTPLTGSAKGPPKPLQPSRPTTRSPKKFPSSSPLLLLPAPKACLPPTSPRWSSRTLVLFIWSSADTLCSAPR